MLIALLLIVCVGEFLMGILVFNDKTLKGRIYSQLRSTLRESDNHGYITQPYLGYSNRPQPICSDSSFTINRAGLKRIGETTIGKPSSTYRILFLGGPSTWGMTHDLRNTFPILIENELNKKIDSLTKTKFKKVECLNAGLIGATSAEILSQYVFKWRYYNPDLIVIHAGFNDAFTYLCQAYDVKYQPDYHTAKRVLPIEIKLNGFIKPLLKSKIISYIIIKVLYHDFLTDSPRYNPFFKYQNSNIWFDYGNDSLYSPKYNALYNNISALTLVAQSCGQKVLLVPEFYYKYDTLFGKSNEALFKKGMITNDSLFKKIADEKHILICYLDIKNFAPDMFPDGEDRYVNEKGEKTKAKLILPYITSEIIDTNKSNRAK
jgi:hypothetical protein